MGKKIDHYRLRSSLWNVNFGFAVKEVYWDVAVDSHAVRRREENIADDLSVGKWMVTDSFTDAIINPVGCTD